MAQAIFYVNGTPASSAKCGDSLYLDIPGNSQVWLTQYQNGHLQYDGLYNLPAPAYVLDCTRDVGTYQGTAYQVVNNQKGGTIASWTFVVQNAAAPIGTPPTTAAGPTTTQCLSGLCGPSAPSPTQIVTTGAPGPTGTNVVPTGGPGIYVAPAQPAGGQVLGGGLSYNGDLPGAPAPLATQGGLPEATPAPAVAGVTFNFGEFIKSPLFLLLIGLVILVYFLTGGKLEG